MRKVNKYDDRGRLIEWALYQNNQELWHRKLFTYDGVKRTVQLFDNKGQQMFRTTETLDKNGNVVEEADHDTIYIKSYQLDKQGNWIVEKTFETESESARKLLWTTYRQIDYYP
jgi:hypothetical protein